MSWKIVDRACLFLGAVFAGVCAYYTMAGYYGWKYLTATPAPVPASGTAMVPPWWLYITGGLGVALLITGWVMMIARRREDTRQPAATLLIPNIRIADRPAVVDLFAGQEADKILPLLEAGELTAWGRPPGRGDPPLTGIDCADWKTHYLEFLPKEGPGTQNQTWLKKKQGSGTNISTFIEIAPSLKKSGQE